MILTSLMPISNGDIPLWICCIVFFVGSGQSPISGVNGLSITFAREANTGHREASPSSWGGLAWYSKKARATESAYCLRALIKLGVCFSPIMS